MRKAAHLVIVEANRMLMAVRKDGTVGFIGGKQEENETLACTIMREFKEEMGFTLSNRIASNMEHIMAAPVSRDLKCTLFLHKSEDVCTYIPHVLNYFKPNEELCGVISVDISPENRKSLMKMNFANGVKEQMEVLFKHVL